MIRTVSEDRRDSMVSDVEAFLLKRRLSDGHLLDHMQTFHLAFVVRTDSYIYDHEIYSKQLLPAKFDENQASLALLCDEISGAHLLTYMKQIPKDLTDIEDEVVDLPQTMICDDLVFTTVDEFGVEVYVIFVGDESGAVKELHIPKYLNKFVMLRPELKAEVALDAHVASCIFHEMNRSRRLRKGFLRYVRKWHQFQQCPDHPYPSDKSDELSGVLDLPCLVEIRLIWPKQKLDYAWDYRIQCQVYKRVQLEETMAWLNTLGGGYSAMGDYFTHHAVQAGRISLHQLKISLELGDPVSAAKCRLFFAQSLLQCGYLRECKRIVRAQYKFAHQQRVRDEKLEAISFALWNRLKYLYSLKKNNKLVKTAGKEQRTAVLTKEQRT